MSSKKPHTKSRLGCKCCKARRIKCDEKAPRCGNCTRKGLECDFEQYAALFDTMRVLTPTSFPQEGMETPPKHLEKRPRIDPNVFRGTDNVVQPPRRSKSSESYSMRDLGLLHYFTLNSSYTIGAIESALYHDVWRLEVPRLAQKHGFLMHAVLAFAAAHQLADSDIHPSLRDYDVVREHYSIALVEFREAVDVIDGERAEALLCFGILTSFLTLHLECVAQPTASTDFIGGLATFLRMVQNSTRVLAQVRSELASSTIGVLLSHTRTQEPRPIDPQTEQSLFTLENLAQIYISSTATSPGSNSSSSSCTALSGNPVEGIVLRQGLAQLRQLFALTRPKEKGWKFILLWPIKLLSPFIQLVEENNPVALCALAHWCVPIYHAPKKWFTSDFAKHTLEAVAQKLAGTQWEEGIQWPLSATVGAGHTGDEDLLHSDFMFY